MSNRLVGTFLVLGLIGCKSDFQQTLELAEAGSTRHQVRISKMYLQGNGIQRSEGRALYWAHKAAIHGDAEAQLEVAKFYFRNRLYDKFGNGGIEELSPMSYLSYYWLKISAGQGNGEAVALLADFQRKGVGTPQNPEAAYRLLIQHADRGHPAVLYRLALFYLNGYGVAQNSAKGVDLLAKAVQKGYSPARSEYCYLIEEGVHLRFDSKSAFECYQKAASMDPELGSYVAGRYAFGHGVAQDSVLAYSWYLLEKVHSNGSLHPNNEYRFALVGKRLDPLDRLEARYLAFRWKPGEVIQRIR